MTVDQMLEKYPKSVVDVIFNRDYMKYLYPRPARQRTPEPTPCRSRNAAMESSRCQINEGVHVESCKRGIRDTEAEDLPVPPIDPDEPSNLEPDTLWRIIMLKYVFRDCPAATGDDEMDIEFVYLEESKNVNGILDVYRSGKVKVVEGQMTVWYAGKLKMGPMPQGKFNREDLVEKVPEWRKDDSRG